MGQVQGEADGWTVFSTNWRVFPTVRSATVGGEGFTQTLGGKVGMRVEFCRIQTHHHLQQSIGSNLHLALRHIASGLARGWCASTRRSETS
jgi:hypothetical protein